MRKRAARASGIYRRRKRLELTRESPARKGETVFDVGQEATDMFVVLSGSVSVMSTYRGKKLKKVWTLCPLFFLSGPS
jgi:CRP-like cAMP-binding protein